ncbi:DUF3883 domain-containing protein [Piscinibacter sp.]|mgnify:CR=1 FL=1|jgi:hypothetical protein|uniref:protein NO VEIN domain-containing protein n=1 Tax=Piscinibacter sp. TaxID=1903157 RepID=UPI001D7BCF5A|nr:DUF3883 domain-containing protein [Piscinibacter sp.]MBK7532070.1 DUF3883 domain-containing protein [Piscinibacter sp.]
MYNEVHPVVLAVVEDKRLSGPKLGPTELVERMGVRDARELPYEYAWVAAGNSIIVTIWTEFVHVHSSGRWFYIDSFDTQHRLGGGDRSDEQKQRAERRLGLLKRAYDARQSLRVVLQTNQVPIAELERNKSAKVSVRVRDDDEWHVAEWNDANGYAVLVRGLHGWSPNAAEVAAALTTGRANGAVAVAPASATSSSPAPAPAPAAAASTSPPAAAQQSPTAPGGEPGADETAPATAPGPRLVFPDQATRDRVEAAAMAHMTAHYESMDLRVHDVSDQNLGYDLEVTDARGASMHKVEVKGTSAQTPGFFLTLNERACSTREPTWCLAVVTDALGAAKHQVYTPEDMEKSFAFEALVWRCDPAN